MAESPEGRPDNAPNPMGERPEKAPELLGPIINVQSGNPGVVKPAIQIRPPKPPPKPSGK